MHQLGFSKALQREPRGTFRMVIPRQRKQGRINNPQSSDGDDTMMMMMIILIIHKNII
jgi:hypothetical protein